LKQTKHILPLIVLSQFCCTSLWFAGNGVINDLIISFNLNTNALGHLTSAVQFGFIGGTLVFAILALADRFSPSKVFFISAIFGALFNGLIIWEQHSLSSLLVLRFLTGFCLAGIYPVGMKIASDYYKDGLGQSLSLLVGALVIGTAFPHILKDLTASYPWKLVIITTSILAIIGGLLILLFVPNGPYCKVGAKTEWSACFKVFKKQSFRAVAFGYFGHMWELYTFWAFVPIMLKTYTTIHPEVVFNIPLLSFFIIGIGGLACVLFGSVSKILGEKKTASLALLLSGVCCLVSPLLFTVSNQLVFIIFLMFWGMVVVADSPLLSTLVVQKAPSDIKGTALTIVNCLGYFITIISLQCITLLLSYTNSNFIYIILAIGPILGLVTLNKKQS